MEEEGREREFPLSAVVPEIDRLGLQVKEGTDLKEAKPSIIR